VRFSLKSFILELCYKLIIRSGFFWLGEDEKTCEMKSSGKSILYFWVLKIKMNRIFRLLLLDKFKIETTQKRINQGPHTLAFDEKFSLFKSLPSAEHQPLIKEVWPDWHGSEKKMTLICSIKSSARKRKNNDCLFYWSTSWVSQFSGFCKCRLN